MINIVQTLLNIIVLTLSVVGVFAIMSSLGILLIGILVALIIAIALE